MSDRPKDFNIPPYVTDKFVRQITKLVPGVGTDRGISQGYQEPSDLSEYTGQMGNSWATEPDPSSPANPMFEFSVQRAPHYPVFKKSLDEYNTQTAQGRSWNKLFQRMKDSWRNGERGPDTQGYAWPTQSLEDEHHQLGHWESHLNRVANFRQSLQNYLRVTNIFHPSVQQAMMGLGPGPDQELTERVRSARQKADKDFQAMHDHLHGTCTRSDKKGGPCGYFGIPRSPEHCDYCKYGNPARAAGDIMKFASDEDPWATGEDTFQKPTNITGPVGHDLPKRPRPEVDSDVVNAINSLPGAQNAEAGFAPVQAPYPGQRHLHIENPQTGHQQAHWAIHNQMYQALASMYDEFHRARTHYDNLEEMAGDHPDERQTALLAEHRQKLAEMIPDIHDLYHEMHAQFHSPCTECGAWNNQRDKHSCFQCAEGCPFCEESDPRKYSSGTPRNKLWQKMAHGGIQAGNPRWVPIEEPDWVEEPLWEPRPETVPTPAPAPTPVREPEKVPASPSEVPQEMPATAKKSSTWDVVSDWEDIYLRKIAEQGLDILKAPTEEEIEDGPIVHQGFSSWVKQAEGLAGSNDQLYMDPMLTGDGSSGPSIQMTPLVDQGTSTEGLTAFKRTSWVVVSDNLDNTEQQSTDEASNPTSGSAVAPGQGQVNPSQGAQISTPQAPTSTTPSGTSTTPSGTDSKGHGGGGGGFNPFGLLKGVGELVGGGAVDAVSTFLAPESGGASLAGDVVGTGLAANGVSSILHSL